MLIIVTLYFLLYFTGEHAVFGYNGHMYDEIAGDQSKIFVVLALNI